MNADTDTGAEMYGWAKDLFPICRSITGDGVRQTLEYVAEVLPELTVHEVPSGTQAFDWTVPDEWTIRDAYIEDETGNRVVDFKDSNLHVVNYSEPVDTVLSLEGLQDHLHSLPDRPQAIPYVTSYYERRWGFCISHAAREKLQPGNYRVVIDSTLEPGSLSYGEIVLPGREEKEILLSTYICHPSMANNELSGPVVTMALVRWLRDLPDRRYTYRIVLAPETIGSIVYISRHLDQLKQRTVAAFNMTCVGDDRAMSFLPSKSGDTPADRAARHVLKHLAPDYISYSFLERGSDERQYCSAGVDLPMVSIMRSKYGTYPEYHTSDDDLSLISPGGLAGAYEAIQQSILVLENNATWRSTIYCEPQLSKRGLASSLGANRPDQARRLLMDVHTHCTGQDDALTIAEKIGAPMWDVVEAMEILEREDLLERDG